MAVKLTQEQFVSRASEKHKGRYDYSESVYVNAKTKLKIICPEHGPFMQDPFTHMKGVGCPVCAKAKRSKTNKTATFYRLQKEIQERFNGNIELVKESYKGRNKKITAKCKQHGEFEQTVEIILRSGGCPACRDFRRRAIKVSFSEFVERSSKKHSGKYSYVKDSYKGVAKKVTIICPEHGEFRQIANSHMRGCGCPSCGSFSMWDKRGRVTVGEYIDRAMQVHKGKYSYIPESFNGTSNKILIICPKHGTFKMSAGNHLYGGQGCPRCSTSGPSKPEQFLADYLSSLGFTVEQSRRDLIPPQEIDIYLPEQKLAIEFNGSYWHSGQKKERNYHLDKTLACQEKGIRLVHIFDYQLAHKRDIVLRMLAKLAGVPSEPVMARKCEVYQLSPEQAAQFYDQHHLMGATGAKLHLGLFYQDRLVAAASFSTRSTGGKHSNKNELIRYCVPPELSVSGGLAKLTKAAMRWLGWETVYSYVERSWFDGAMYEKNGWEQRAVSEPGYGYVHRHSLQFYHRSRFMKKKLKRQAEIFGFDYDPSLSEAKMLKNSPLMRVFDCGQLLYQFSLN